MAVVPEGATATAVESNAATLSRPARVSGGGGALQVGDVMYALTCQGGGAQLSPPGAAPWASLRRWGVSGGNMCELWRRVVAAGEPATYAFGSNQNSLIHAAVVAVSGADAAAPEDVVGPGNTYNANGTAALASGVTTTEDGTLLVTFHHWAGNNITITSNQPSAPTGMTEWVDHPSAGASTQKRLLAVNYEQRPTQGATGDRTATASQSGAVRLALALAIAPSQGAALVPANMALGFGMG